MFLDSSNCLSEHLKVLQWLDSLNAMLKEAKWSMNKSESTMEEYMENAYVSFAMGPIVLSALYLVGPKLSEDAVRSSEYYHLFRLMSTIGRLFNDMQGNREAAEGKINSVTLAMIHCNGSIREEEVIDEMKRIITSKRRELQGLVLQEKDSVIPRCCTYLMKVMMDTPRTTL
ncbi:hypothetical protein ACLB2K_023259 [Fragaria x ananassa]